MNTSLQEFIFEWGMLITAIICIIGGYCHAWVCAVGTPNQKTITFVILITVMCVCEVASIVLSAGVPDVRELKGQFIARIFLGVPVSMFAGIGLFAWCSPDKWIQIGEDRKYKKDLKKL
jgi:hypothetical protein